MCVFIVFLVFVLWQIVFWVCGGFFCIYSGFFQCFLHSVSIQSMRFQCIFQGVEIKCF